MSDIQGIPTVYERNGSEVVAIGDVDFNNLDALTSMTDEMLEDETVDVISLDLTRVPFMDSSGLRTLLALERKSELRNKRVSIKPNQAVKRMLQITGTTEQFIIVEPEKE